MLDADHSTLILKVVEEEIDTQERLRNVAEDTRLAKAMVGRLIRQSSAIFTSWYSHPCVILSPLGWARLNVSEKAMAPHSSTLAWKIPWMEEPHRLQYMGSLRVEHD